MMDLIYKMELKGPLWFSPFTKGELEGVDNSDDLLCPYPTQPPLVKGRSQPPYTNHSY